MHNYALVSFAALRMSLIVRDDCGREEKEVVHAHTIMDACSQRGEVNSIEFVVDTSLWTMEHVAKFRPGK